MRFSDIKKHTWSQKVIAIFKQGLGAKELSLSITLGMLFGVLPLFGIATPLIIWLAVVLRLNAPIAIFMTYAVSPLHVLLIIPFIRVGEFIFSAGNAFLSFQDLKMAFQEEGLALLNDLAMQVGFGLTGWMIVAIPVSVFLFLGLWRIISYSRSF